MTRQKIESLTSYLYAYDKSIFSELLCKTPYPWELSEIFMSWLKTKSQKAHPCLEGVFLKNPSLIVIEDGALIDPGSMLEGPCYIGEGAHIGHGALIRAGSFIGPNAVVGHGSEINRSILLERAKAAHFNYVGDSVLGFDVNLGAHATCANLRLDQKNIIARFEDQRVDTGLRKVGAFIGDGASIGCQALLNPGVVVAKKGIVFPQTTQSGFVSGKREA